jgi:hypothetical protein
VTSVPISFDVGQDLGEECVETVVLHHVLPQTRPDAPPGGIVPSEGIVHQPC